MIDEKMLRSGFAKRLRELRHASGMTQRRLSELINLDRSTYAYYESEKTCPSFDTLVRLSRVFRVSLDYLISGKEPEPVQVMVRQNISPALEGAASYAGLTEGEQAFLAMYRQMNPEEREKLYQFAFEQVNAPKKSVKPNDKKTEKKTKTDTEKITDLTEEE